MEITTESKLVSISNGETVGVIDTRLVNFRGQPTSLTNAMRVILGNGYHVAPGRDWTFNGRKLKDIYDEP